MSVEDMERYNTIVVDIQRLRSQSNNTDKLKEEMVAAMTKEAIMNNPALLAIRASVLKITE
jgi:hypothetical protein